MVPREWVARNSLSTSSSTEGSLTKLDRGGWVNPTPNMAPGIRVSEEKNSNSNLALELGTCWQPSQRLKRFLSSRAVYSENCLFSHFIKNILFLYSLQHLRDGRDPRSKAVCLSSNASCPCLHIQGAGVQQC